MSRNSFERFYYEKVALGEGCGCAEQIIGTRDLDDSSREAAFKNAVQTNPGLGPGAAFGWFRRLFARQT